MKIKTIGISVVLVLSLLVSSIVPAVAQQDKIDLSTLDNSGINTAETYQNELEICKKSGEEFVRESLETTSPEWEGAKLVDATAYYDLQGNLVGYLFGVAKDGKSIGYLMTGSSCYSYSVLEAAETAPPIIPSIDEAKSIIEASMGVKGATISESLPVYLGYNLFYAVYDCSGQSVGINLRTKGLTKYEELEPSLATPEQYKAYYADEVGGSTKDVDWVVLQVIQRDMDDVPDCDDNCGPTTGAMISYWWKQAWGCSNLPTWYDDHDELYDEMHCNDWDLPPLIWGADGVPPWNFGPGFREYADNHGYDDFVTDWCLNRGYDKIQNEIYACRPMGVMFSYNLYYTNWHWCCVKGFDTRGAVDYIIMNDPRGFESIQNWGSVKGTSTITRIWRE